MTDSHILELKARHRELAVKTLMLRKRMKKKPEFMFLPAGTHLIRPMEGAEFVLVAVDEKTAAVCELQRELIVGHGDLPFFDLNHESSKAAFLVEKFYWRDGADDVDAGVFVRGVFTDAGQTAIARKEFWAFSPVFCVDDVRNAPARVVCCQYASGNLGGFVSNPAFGTKLRLRVTEVLETKTEAEGLRSF